MHVINSAKIFVENNEGKILLLRRTETAPTHPLEWDLPGGIVELDEDIRIGALRELFEEAGIQAFNLKEKFVITKEHGDKVINHHYLTAECGSVTVSLSYEHDTYVWCDKDKFTDYITRPQFIEAYTRAYRP